MGESRERKQRWGGVVPAMMFSTGDKVEVTSDDEGFRGAWYEAKVARFLPRANRYTVVYDHLLADDDDAADPRPLRETVAAAYVRPRPPRVGGPPFGPHCAVDAWHNDGWWVGVVVAAAGARRGKGQSYLVCFPGTREEMEFGAAELRAHLEWVDNQWVKPGESATESTAMAFPVGCQVEVSCSTGGSLNAWFVAIVEKLIWKNNLLVKYQNFGADDTKERLREIVDVQYVRPFPSPGPGLKIFDFLEDVEVFYGDGWCTGVVSKVCAGLKYIVKSRHWDGEKEFYQHDMRVLREWIDGRWVLATKNIQGHLDMLFERGTKVEVSSDDEGFRGAWYTATVVELLNESMFLVEYESLRTDDETELLKETVNAFHIRPAPNTPVVKKFKFFEEVDAFYNDGWWIGVISRVLEGSRYMVYFRDSKEELEFGHNELRLHLDWINGKWIQTSQVRVGIPCFPLSKFGKILPISFLRK